MQKVFYLLMFALLFVACSDSDKDEDEVITGKLAEYEIILEYSDVPDEDYADELCMPVFLFFENSTFGQGQFIKHDSDIEWLFENRIKGENLFTTFNYFKKATFKGKADKLRLSVELDGEQAKYQVKLPTKLHVVIKRDGKIVNDDIITIDKTPIVNYQIYY